jgi:hypothetical protein
MADARTFKIKAPPMHGDDVRNWEKILNKQFDEWRIDFQVRVDGEYRVPDRAATADVLYGLGISRLLLRDGLTPELRAKVRDKRLTRGEKIRMALRRRFRRKLRAKHEAGGVASPVHKILEDSHGFQPGHDGVDLICPEDAPIFAICKAKVIDVRAIGWWGLGAQPSPGHPIADGDGIIQLECLADRGPFKKGMHFGYGHAEHARVNEGETVQAGQRIGRAGFANAPHVHFMVNGGDTTKGIGDRDPMPFVRYAIKHQ